MSCSLIVTVCYIILTGRTLRGPFIDILASSLLNAPIKPFCKSRSLNPPLHAGSNTSSHPWIPEWSDEHAHASNLKTFSRSHSQYMDNKWQTSAGSTCPPLLQQWMTSHHLNTLHKYDCQDTSTSGPPSTLLSKKIINIQAKWIQLSHDYNIEILKTQLQHELQHE